MTTLTSKGQVTIPKAVRDLLGLTPGASVVFELEEDGRVVVRRDRGGRVAAREAAPRDRFARARGTADAGLSTDEIMTLMRGED